MINLYYSENSIENRVFPQSLSIFPEIVNDTIFDKLIEENNKSTLIKILSFSTTVNDINLFKKIIYKHNFFDEPIEKFDTLINKALNYNSVDIFYFLYDYHKKQNIKKCINLMHSNLNPKILEYLLQNKEELLFDFFCNLLLNINVNSKKNVELMIKYNVNFKLENANRNLQANKESENKDLQNSNQDLQNVIELDSDTSLMFLASNLNITILNLVYDETYFNSNQKTILHNAVKLENFHIVEYLIKVKKVNINATDINLTTPLLQACKLKNIEIVNLLLENGAMHTLDIGNRSPIYYAVVNNKLEIVELLFKFNADLNYLDKNRKGLIDFAFEKKNLEIAKFLYYKINNFNLNLSNLKI